MKILFFVPKFLVARNENDVEPWRRRAESGGIRPAGYGAAARLHVHGPGGRVNDESRTDRNAVVGRVALSGNYYATLVPARIVRLNSQGSIFWSENRLPPPEPHSEGDNWCPPIN